MSSIKPEHWHLLPTNPRFGSLIDSCGGRVYRPEKNCYEGEVSTSKRLDTLRETSIGIVEIHSDESGMNILAENLGVGLCYEKNGNLVDAGVDLLTFYMSLSEDQIIQMGGERLDDLMEIMLEKRDKIMLSFDFKDETMAVANLNRISKEAEILTSVSDFDYSIPTVTEINYEEITLCIGFKVVDDVFYFGIMALGEDEVLSRTTKILMMKVLKDCNYQTFLSSTAPDRFEKLVNRIFLETN